MTDTTNFWAWQREQGITMTRCAKHDLSVCATCAGHDDLDEAQMGTVSTLNIVRDTREGTTLGQIAFKGTWDTHSPFHKCTNPACCDPIDTLRQQSGVVPVEQPEPTPDGKCRDTTHNVRNVFGTMICTTCMTEAL